MEETQMKAVASRPNDFLVFHELDLSLTEDLIPVQVPVKQFDNSARRVRCRLFYNAVSYNVPDEAIVSYSATRPDGKLFQYSSETRPDLIYVEDGGIVLTITSFMTEVFGRFPMDIYLLDEDQNVLGTFGLVLNISRSAIKNRKIATLTYKHCLEATIAGVENFDISEDGYLVLYADDGLGLAPGSYSSTIEKVANDIHETLINTCIRDDGRLEFISGDLLALRYKMNDEGQIIILSGADVEEENEP